MADFIPCRFLRNAHLQTLAGALLPRRNRLPIAQSEDRRIGVEPGAEVLCRCHWQPERRKALTVVLVHGLEGSDESRYVIGTAGKAWDAGMNVVRMNMRNCGGTEGLCPTLYHSGLSADVGAVVNALIREDGLTRIAIAGFSMGGNLVLNLAGEWGNQAPKEVRAFAAVCPSMDIAPSVEELHRPLNRLYEWNFVWNLKRRVRRKARLFPGRFDLACLRGVRSLRDFDERVTARYSGFAGAADYYQRVAAANVVTRIAVSTLIVHALDDPFIRITPAVRERIVANSYITFVETRHGGHCGFLAAADGYDGRWAEREIVNFFSEK